MLGDVLHVLDVLVRVEADLPVDLANIVGGQNHPSGQQTPANELRPQLRRRTIVTRATGPEAPGERERKDDGQNGRDADRRCRDARVSLGDLGLRGLGHRDCRALASVRLHDRPTGPGMNSQFFAISQQARLGISVQDRDLQHVVPAPQRIGQPDVARLLPVVEIFRPDINRRRVHPDDAPPKGTDRQPGSVDNLIGVERMLELQPGRRRGISRQ